MWLKPSPPKRELLTAELIGLKAVKWSILLTKCLNHTKSVAISKKKKKVLLHLIIHFIDSELNLILPKLNEKSKQE